MTFVIFHLRRHFFLDDLFIRIVWSESSFAKGFDAKVITAEHLVKDGPIQIVAVAGRYLTPETVRNGFRIKHSPIHIKNQGFSFLHSSSLCIRLIIFSHFLNFIFIISKLRGIAISPPLRGNNYSHFR